MINCNIISHKLPTIKVFPYFLIKNETLFFAQDNVEVIKMAQEYTNLDDLLNRNPKAKDFFDSLPEDRQFNVRQYENNIHYDLDLRRYAEHLLRGGY